MHEEYLLEHGSCHFTYNKHIKDTQVWKYIKINQESFSKNDIYMNVKKVQGECVTFRSFIPTNVQN